MVVERASPGALDVRFRLDGPTSELRIPARRPPRIASRLWEHTCFEAFVAAAGGAAYHEMNFAPSGAWAAFAFRGYRDGEPLSDPALAPAIAVRREAGRLLLDARVPLARLSPAYAGGRLRVALTAVIEAADGGRSFWALRHPAGLPDFHHRDGFALVLET